MESIVITYPEIKKNILKNRKNLINEKIIDINELESKLLFTYDEKAIYYLMKKYHYRYDVAITYLKNLKYGSKCDDFLSKLKIELENNNLLILDNKFKTQARNKKFLLYHLPVGKWEKKLLENLSYREEQILENKKDYNVYEFNSIEDEINFVALQIIDLINNKVNINKIKLMNVIDEYKPYITRVFKFYNIPIELEYTLYSKRETVIFLTILKETKNKDLALKKIKDTTLKNQIIKILNKYYFIEKVDDELIEILLNEFKNTTLKVINYQNKIEEIKHITDENYVFLVGFNDSYPKFYKDEDYLSDKCKLKIGIDTSTEKNTLLEQQLLKEFSLANNIIFTYSKKTKTGEYQISPISSNMNYKIKSNFDDQYIYSNLYNKIKLAKLLDEKNKFNIISPNLNKLYSNYKNIHYSSYKNDFTGINKKNLYEFLNNKLILSYSSIDNYYKCGFRFYLNNILKITPYEETFAIKIGNIFHSILEKYNHYDFDYEKEFKQILTNMEFTNKEQVFLKKLKDDLKFVIDTINKQNSYTSLTEELHEKKVFVNKDKTISVTFMGIIDKIKYTKQNGKTIVAIIDYKTGNPITNITKTLYGLDMQLPIYLYLANNMKEFENIEIIGIYLQKILNNECNYDPNKDYQKQKEENLKLEGYSIDNQEMLSLFDSTYKDSEMIKSMKISKNGFYAYTKIITKDQITNLTKLVDRKIDEARDNILEANFKINPKKMEKENTCKYCPYIDICHRKEEDFTEIIIPNKLDFLSEVDYAQMD